MQSQYEQIMICITTQQLVILAGNPSSGRKVYVNWAMHLIFIPHQTIPFLDLSLSVILLSFLDSLSILHEVNLLLINIYLLFNPLYFPYNKMLLQPSLPF
jgi:hypothetical protein